MKNKEKFQEFLLYGSLIVVIAVFLYSVFSFFGFDKPTPMVQANMEPRKMSRMSFTSFDAELAKQFMDKDNDGRCDACGMPVEMCMDSGQLQCNMDPDSTIGVLGSQHIHADWKVYIDGKPLDFSDKSHMERMKSGSSVSSFIHVDSGAPAPEKTGDILHMHATGVPLWIFFESIGMKFDKECVTLDNGQSYCDDGKNALKLYVNGQKNSQYGEYVFQDNDKIFISYGSENEAELKQQINSITDYAKNH